MIVQLKIHWKQLGNIEKKIALFKRWLSCVIAFVRPLPAQMPQLPIFYLFQQPGSLPLMLGKQEVPPQLSLALSIKSAYIPQTQA